MLQLRAIAGPTSRLLKKMLDERGLLGGPVKGVVNYGYNGIVSYNTPTLNMNAGRLNKYQELVRLDDEGVRTVPFSDRFKDFKEGKVLGRNLHHTRGNDIVIYRAGEGGPKRDFYTELVPKQDEFRVWVFRGKHLATYKKVLDYPAKNGRKNKAIWNWGNGYAYHFVQPDDVPVGLRETGIAAIKALDLDFGASDVICGADGRYYVLEVNTAPGTQGAARQGITSLVNCIQRWVQNGFKERT
jgi:hypothetical protein